MAHSHIPVVDFQKLAVTKEEDVLTVNEFLAVGNEIRRAFEDVGFVYLQNHGIPETTIEENHKKWEKFFRLPEETKNKYSKLDYRKENQGYVGNGRESLCFEKDFKNEIRESYDISDLKGMLPVNEISNIDLLTSQLADYGLRLAFRLLVAIEASLALERGRLLECHAAALGDLTLLRTLYYPPVPEDTKEGATRCGSHSDYGTFTLLFQDTMGGLEVLDRTGIWQPATPVPGTILVNVGDLLQMWTSDKFIATKHRVVIPAEELKKRCSRHSIVLFFHPKKDVIVRPLDGSSRYEPISSKDYLAKQYNITYRY